MGSMSIWHWIIVAVIVLLLFGKGRISEMMGDMGKGIKSFKKGLADEESPPSSQPSQPPLVTQQPQQPSPLNTEQSRTDAR